MARKRQVQQEISFRKRRPGAGRPKKAFGASERHAKRAKLDSRFPVHAIVRVEKDVGSLRTARAFRAMRRAVETSKARTDFRAVEISLQRNHIHLVVEAANEIALARGMQSLQISAARHLNRALKRSGRVFVDRYHARILKSPTEVRRVLNYVMNNWRHHDEDRGMETMFWDVDYYSSGPHFRGWKEGAPDLHPKYQPLQMCAPDTWLLRDGWTRGGGPISMYARPGRDCYERR